MGLFDIFKRKKKARPSYEENLSPQDLISLREKQVKELQKSAIKTAKERISSLINELDKEIPAIEKVNLNEKKVEDKIKAIVQGNLESFLRQVKRLKQNLEELNQKEFGGLQEIAKEADSVLHDFEKKSYMGFEKATYLVGKELGDVVNSISSFFRDIKKIISDNKKLIDASHSIERIKSVKQDILDKDKAKEEIENEINEIKNKLKKVEKEEKALSREAENIKNSEEYKKKAEKKIELEEKKYKLKKKIDELRSLINLKRLAGIFHSSEKQMPIIKEMKEDFQAAFEKYKAEKVLEMTSEAENKEEIRRKAEEISFLKQQIKELYEYLSGKDELLELRKTLSQLDTERALLIQEKDKIENKKEQVSLDIKRLESQKEKEISILRGCDL
ncbi:MAG TPA: hypothetical protein ENN46_01915 [Candidatus Woesearchaeota archaeon]|nr:hypothetical protein [Candidatus Woesearchaeota archaeon]